MSNVPVLPEYQAKLLGSARCANFSLYFTRMTVWSRSMDGKLEHKFQVSERKFEPSIVLLGQRGNDLLQRTAIHLQDCHKRQAVLLERSRNDNGFALEIKARLTSPFVSGLGSGHPTETGMILDRNTGMPFIPASAIKGVLRLAHSINLFRSGTVDQWVRNGIVDNKGHFKEKHGGSQLELDDREPSLRKYFGDTDTGATDGVRGQLVFLDAFPEAPPSLKANIMNPHFHKYYEGSVPPEDCIEPNPIKFLSVQVDTVFVFRVLAAPLAHLGEAEAEPVDREFGPEDVASVRAMFATAFDELGFGGKTAVGYGRFAPMDGTTAKAGSAGTTEANELVAEMMSPSSTVSTLDPETARQAEIAAFCNSLPKRNMLPSEMDKLIEAIKRKNVEETRKRCCEVLLRFAETDSKGFKKAKKDGKQWAVKLTTLCDELGVT